MWVSYTQRTCLKWDFQAVTSEESRQLHPASASSPLIGRAEPSFAWPGGRQGGHRREGFWGLGAMVPIPVASRMTGRGCLQAQSLASPLSSISASTRSPPLPHPPSFSLSELGQVYLEEEGISCPYRTAASVCVLPEAVPYPGWRRRRVGGMPARMEKSTRWRSCLPMWESLAPRKTLSRRQ